jgi:hypothetical protein
VSRPSTHGRPRAFKARGRSGFSLYAVVVQIVFEFREFVLLTATLALFAIEAWAFVDAISRRPEVFVAADKQTKTMWLVILGVALGAHMLIWHPIHILNMVGAIASLVYLVDVRPAVRSLSRR